MTSGQTIGQWGFDLAALKSELHDLREMRRRRARGAFNALAGIAPFAEDDAASDEEWKRGRRTSGGGSGALSGSQAPVMRGAPTSLPAAQSPIAGIATGGSAPAALHPASVVAGARDAEADDEFRRKKGAAGGGGGSDALPRVGIGTGCSANGQRNSHSPERSPVAVKTALAGGSQAAVVKLASFGAGRTRAQSLLNYQTDRGELVAEREDGTILKGREDIAALAADWGAESSGREPSKDSLHFTAAFDEPLAYEAVRDALHEALRGHAFAWRAETREGQTHVHVVALAAGSLRDDNGKAERFYPNKKSIDGLHDRIEDAFNRDAKVEIRGWAHGVEGATRQLARLTRAGELDAETSRKQDLKEEALRLYERRGGKSENADKLNPNLEIAKSWSRQMRSNEPRDFAHIIFSAKPGTDKDAFLDAARATLAKEFAGHEYVFVMHTNRQHIHVHAAVRMENDRGERLHPNIGDFRQWRETLAEQARERHIPMEATSRFDEANVPAYKLKDIRMVEKGVAPASVRRRVEAVQQRAIHRPTREEGRAHAGRVAGEWGAASQHFEGRSPPADLLRLRGRTEQAMIPHPETPARREGPPMRTAETMTAALASMRKNLDNILAVADPDKKEIFEQHRASIIEAAEKAIEAQKKLEAKAVEMSGDRYVAPVAMETTPHITHERKGQEIHYSRHDDTGQRVALAFVDKGKQLYVTEWTQKETVLAALRVAASKWETINIIGNERYKETVVQLAAEHGFKITNPELQDRIEKTRAEIAAQRPAMGEDAKEGAATADERQRRLDLENLEREKQRELQRQVEKPRHRE